MVGVVDDVLLRRKPKPVGDVGSVLVKLLFNTTSSLAFMVDMNPNDDWVDSAIADA